MPAAVELTGIRKTFPGVVANDAVNLTVDVGEIHALCGENGAGKTTLMKILYGELKPDAGTIAVNGEPVTFAGPADAIARGIGMVHQHFMLADNFTVVDNVALGLAGRLDRLAIRRRIIELGGAYGLTIDPGAMVADLGVGDRQRIEIVKVLYRGAKIIILDEPTAVLVPAEVNALFENLRRLTAAGHTIIFISHKLDEVRSIADRITILRGGTTVVTTTPAESTASQLAELMVGHRIDAVAPPTTQPSTEPALQVTDLATAEVAPPRRLDGVSFTVHSGEIIGIAGVEGNGQSELVEGLLGLVPVTGTVALAERDVTRLSTARRRSVGLAVIPEDRHRQALLLAAPLWENRILGSLPRFTRYGLLRPAAAKSSTATLIEEYHVKAVGPLAPAFTLSGGNQQKLVVARELSAGPKVIIAAQPTRGVDVAAQAEILARLRNAADDGAGVLLISADLDELRTMCHRILVFLRGKVVAELPAGASVTALGAAMTGAVDE